jgi:integrase
MARTASNVLVFNDLVVKQAVNDARGQPQREWRFERVLNPGKKDGGKPLERRAPMPGLIFMTQPTGRGVFYKFYRNQLGAPKKLRLGDYDEIGLEGARKLWEEQTLSVAGGSDPVGNKHALRSAMTFKELAELFVTNGPLKATTRGNYKRHLETRIYGLIGEKPCETVTSQDVLALCRKAEAEGHYPLSNVIKSIIGGAYKYGRNQGFCNAKPCLGIGRRGKKVARDRTPTSDEIVALWRAIDANGKKLNKQGKEVSTTACLSHEMKLIIKLGIVTAQRRTEIAGVQRSELVGLDGKDPKWIIPGDENKRGKIVYGRTKNGREHHVPLSPLAVKLFKEAIENCADKTYVFPADASKVKIGKDARLPHIHGESVSKAVRRLRASADVQAVTIHDMRRAASNYMKDQGVSREIRDLALNHMDGSVDGQHYSQGARMPVQVRAALEAWSWHVESLLAGQTASGSNVVSLRA